MPTALGNLFLHSILDIWLSGKHLHFIRDQQEKYKTLENHHQFLLLENESQPSEQTMQVPQIFMREGRLLRIFLKHTHTHTLSHPEKEEAHHNTR